MSLGILHIIPQIAVDSKNIVYTYPIAGVGLSNILDNELNGGKPMEGSHRQVVGTGIVDDELLCKVIQRVEVVARIEALLILTVAALDFAVVPWRIRADQLVPDAQFGGCLFKQRL